MRRRNSVDVEKRSGLHSLPLQTAADESSHRRKDQDDQSRGHQAPQDAKEGHGHGLIRRAADPGHPMEEDHGARPRRRAANFLFLRVKPYVALSRIIAS